MKMDKMGWKRGQKETRKIVKDSSYKETRRSQKIMKTTAKMVGFSEDDIRGHSSVT